MSQSEDSSERSSNWISWFCSLEDHQFYCKVDEDFIRDPFNLYGLKKQFMNYEEALEMITELDAPQEDDHDNPNFMSIYQEAIDLYGLVHA